MEKCSWASEVAKPTVFVLVDVKGHTDLLNVWPFENLTQYVTKGLQR